MKNLSWRLCLLTALAWLALFGRPTAVVAAEEERGAAGERLDRLEQRLNELAQRQEQMMHNLGASPQRQGPMHGPGPDNMRPQMPMAGPGMPQGGKIHEDIHGLLKLMFLVGIIF